MDKFRKQLNSYFQQTTLHGFAYISASQSWTERIFWILALLWSLSCCIFLIYELTVKVVTNPIIIQQPDKPVHIKDIPFPAVSFCPVHFTEDPYIMYSSLLVNNSVSFPPDLSNYTQCGSNWKNLDNYVINSIEFKGSWMRKFRLRPNYVISPFGWCLTINSMNYDKMFRPNETAEYFQFQTRILQTDKDLDYKIVDEKKIYMPFIPDSPLFTDNKNLGLYVACLRDIDHYNRECPSHEKLGFIYGPTFTVVIHSPFERPDTRHRNFVAKIMQSYSILVTAEIEATHENLLDLDLDDRKCYKANEKVLKVFSSYTRINCLRECESFFILDKCGCVPYHFINKNASFICTPTKIKTCFEPEYAMFNESTCKCYPTCEQLNYRLDIQMTEVEKIEELMYSAFLGAIFMFTFKDDSFFPQVRRKYFTMIDWFSFVGGILGLFFGFSFLSGFEMIFHVWLGFFGKSSSESSTSRRSWMWKRVVDYLKSFMDSSSIHGFSYISDSTMRIFERIAWSITFTLSITACGLMIIELRERLTIDSLSLISSDKTANLTEFPFPAVTMMFPVDTLERDESESGHKIHKLVRYILGRNTRYGQQMGKDHSLNISEYLGHQIGPFLRKYSNMNDRYVPWMEWNGWYGKDEQPALGQKILTSKGMIYNFNMIKFKDMFDNESVSHDFSYKRKFFNNGPENVDSYVPFLKYPLYSGDQHLKIIRTLPVFLMGTRFHMSIFLHSPFEYPFEFLKQRKDRVGLTHDKFKDVLVTLDVITTDDDLKPLPILQRKCYLENERKLKYFKIYTQRNCHIECLSQELLNTCGCVPFDIVRGSDTRVCQFEDEDCAETIRNDFTFDDSSCSCLQQCEFFSYNFEFVQTNHRDLKSVQYQTASYQEIHNTTKKVLGQVTVKFKEKEFATMQRVRTFTTVDFLSYIGGLLGLFAGISVLSIFEIFYFLTLRMICEIFRFLRIRKRVEVGNVMIVAPVNEN